MYRFHGADAERQVLDLYPDIPGNGRARIDLHWPIYNGGRSDALERAARAEVDAIGQDRPAAQAYLKLEICAPIGPSRTANAWVRVLTEALTHEGASTTRVTA